MHTQHQHQYHATKDYTSLRIEKTENKIREGFIYIRRLPQFAIHWIYFYLIYISLLILIPNSNLFVLIYFTFGINSHRLRIRCMISVSTLIFCTTRVTWWWPFIRAETCCDCEKYENKYILSVVDRLHGLVVRVLGFVDRHCGLVVRVLGYRSGGPGSIPCTIRKQSSGSGTGSTRPREYNWGATW
jgi:hypothetical protein